MCSLSSHRRVTDMIPAKDKKGVVSLVSKQESTSKKPSRFEEGRL